MKSVASTGCFSTSARLFGVSQPTISNAISDLEEELRVRVFRRTTRCVELTPFGASIIGYVECIVGLVEEIEQEAERHSHPDRELLRVAFSPIIDSSRLFGLFESFRSARRAVEFVYKECADAELESRLGKDKLDVICGIRIHDAPALGRCMLYDEVLRFLPKGGFANAPSSDAVSFAEISSDTLILPVDTCGLAPAIRELFRQRGIELDEYPGHPLSYSVLQEWSRAGIGAAILPESKIVGDSMTCPVVMAGDGRAETITVEAVWMRGNHDPLVKEFTRFLKENALPAGLGRHQPTPLPEPAGGSGRHGAAVQALCQAITAASGH
jgi:DNA-binding transcriptional LysR family regulator